MRIYCVRDFVDDMGYSSMDYFCNDTLDQLNTYVDDEYDTSEFDTGDMFRVSMSSSGEFSDDNEGIFFWNGSRLVFPFYNGELNSFGSNEYEIDQEICPDGFVPNLFQVIHDFHPDDPYQDNGIDCNRIYFTDLSSYYDDIKENFETYEVESSVSSDLSITKFYANGEDYILVYPGEVNKRLGAYLKCNRPYDFDIDSALSEYDVEISSSKILDMCDLDSAFIIFVHPKYLDISYDSCGRGGIHARARKSRGGNSSNYDSSGISAYATKPSFTVKEKRYCCKKTGKGKTCSRMAKDGYDYCGIHLRY